MIPIHYPEKKPALRKLAGRMEIFCAVRRRWMLVTPEEWVRQNLLLWLTEELGYPLPLIAVEKQVMVGHMSHRFDILVHSRNGNPYMIIECKEPDDPLHEGVLEQAMRYNISLRAPYLMISNGKACRAYRLREGRFDEVHEPPLWNPEGGQ